MLKKYLEFSFAFLIIFSFHLIAIVNKIQFLAFATKPLITFSLMFYLVYKMQFKGRFSKRIFIGLLFSLFGDVFLMLLPQKENYFIAGLLSFLIAQIFYISAFYLDFKPEKQINKIFLWLAIAFFGSFCIGFYLYLRPYLSDLKIPVMVYGFVISFMAILALNRVNNINKTSFIFIFLGAIMFLLSDSLLAYSKFVQDYKFSNLYIMATYMVAQYAITIGAVERKVYKKRYDEPKD